MGLFKKLVKAYKDDRRETQAFLAKVEAEKPKQTQTRSEQKPLKQKIIDHVKAEFTSSDNHHPDSSKTFVSSSVATPKKYSPSFRFVCAPTKIDDMTQAYRYGFALSDIVPEVLKAAFEAEQYLFEVKQADGIIYAMLGGQIAGIVNERCEMISDWIRRDEPFRLFLNSYTEGEDCKVFLVFYKDKSAAHKWREQSVVPLTAYKGKARQEISAYLYTKEEVEIGEEYFGNDDDDAVVTYKGEAIGKVPPKIRNRIAEDGYSYAEIDELIEEENDNGDDIYHPVIRIYW